MDEMTADIRVSLLDIIPNSWNPHRMTEEEQLELEASVLEDGQWRPILVVEMDTTDETVTGTPKPYRIVDGEHLYKSLMSLHMAGKGPSEARVMVIGKNSEIPIWKQQEIGQTINHGMRGSIEDPAKTREVVSTILKHRKPEVVARRMGIGVDGVRHLSKTPTRIKRSNVPRFSSAVTGKNEERKNYTVALVFESSEQLAAFENQVSSAADFLGLSREDFKGRAGQFRIAVLEQALDELGSL